MPNAHYYKTQPSQILIAKHIEIIHKGTQAKMCSVCFITQERAGLDMQIWVADLPQGHLSTKWVGSLSWTPGLGVCGEAGCGCGGGGSATV